MKVQSRDDRLSSDAGTLLLCEADQKLAVVESLAAGLRDPQDPAKVRYTQVELLWERLYALARGYGAGDDLDLTASGAPLRPGIRPRGASRRLRSMAKARFPRARARSLLEGAP